MAEDAHAGAPQSSDVDDGPQSSTHPYPLTDGNNLDSQSSDVGDGYQHSARPSPLMEGIDSASQIEAVDHASPTRSGELQPPFQLHPSIQTRRRSASDSSVCLHRPSLSADTDNHECHATTPLASPNPTSSEGNQALPVAPDSSSSPPQAPPTPATSRRARFPSDADKLTRRYSAPKRPRTDTDLDGTKDEADPAEAEKGAGNSDQVVDNDTVHLGWWASFRRTMKNLREELGKHEKTDDLQNLVAATGLDIDAIKKVQGKIPIKGKKKKGHKRLSSLVGASAMLIRPGIGSRAGSTASVAKIHSGNTTGNTSAATSGAVTPNTIQKALGSGIDPRELQKQLQEWKDRCQRNPEDEELVKAKADLAHRRTVVLLLIYAFMIYGAPSHRIEEYIKHLLEKLHLEGRCNYVVGCTEMSFVNPYDPEKPFDRSAYTTLVKAQGLDIGACEEAFCKYKDVVREKVAIEDASTALFLMLKEPPYYQKRVLVLFYGLASALACIWAYDGWWLDMLPAGILGSLVGFLQVVVATHNPLYSNVLEVTAALITSFCARAFASIGPNQEYFCFGAIAESSITIILPGYIVLCGSLELQSRSITAGSTRLFYAVFYSLLLGYGMAVGSQIWLAIYPDAPVTPDCPRSVDAKWKILLVPCYLAAQAVLLRSRPRQIPVQVVIGSAAYAVNYFVSERATGQVANTVSALTLGVLGHLWARSRRAFAFAAVVAGIMVLVPSGLSAQGGLVAGITTPLFNNATTNAQSFYEQNIYQSFSVGAQMITVAVGLTVGLFMSTLVVYPFGRRDNALFSF